jgi:3-hydroxyisobutyrate dehydrogenase-like beta-hydroxyacid dehydrogenase
MKNIGLIGLGLLGSALAKRMLAGGFAVIGYDTSERAAQTAATTGVTIAPSAKDVFTTCDVVLLSLPTTDIVQHVLAEVSAHLRPGHCVIDTTTGDPDQMAALGARLVEQKVEYLDATIAASSAQVLVGDAVVMVGGNAAAFQASKPIFATFSRESFHVGPWGSGARMKLAVNLMLGLSRAALAETLTFAGRCGLDGRLTLEILQAGNAYSRVMDTKGEKMLTSDFTPQGRLSQHLKDVRLIVHHAAKCGAVVPLSQTHQALLEACERAGLGDLDNSAIIKAYEDR